VRTSVRALENILQGADSAIACGRRSLRHRAGVLPERRGVDAAAGGAISSSAARDAGEANRIRKQSAVVFKRGGRVQPRISSLRLTPADPDERTFFSLAMKPA